MDNGTEAQAVGAAEFVHKFEQAIGSIDRRVKNWFGAIAWGGESEEDALPEIRSVKSEISYQTLYSSMSSARNVTVVIEHSTSDGEEYDGADLLNRTITIVSDNGGVWENVGRDRSIREVGQLVFELTTIASMFQALLVSRK